MTGRDTGFFLGGLLGGFAIGYVICWTRRPMPQLVDDQGRSRMQNPARLVLQTGDAIGKIKPILQPIAAGRIPSPLDLYQIVQGVN